MIKINDRFSIEKDQHCWNLHETKPIKTKPGKSTTKTTYHANIPQVCEAILNRSAGDCETVEEIKDLFENAIERLINNIQNKIKPVKRKRVRG